ncbi:hypothetical protein Taro_004492 [Colocasia esculenta]|uniref:Uncharacterized protein n=1 Tax=Colocasia esculenta TaxID=4460 RepID=A0A843TI98_COLES|nr:hypothetical protein [Colocasia esculenta]
MVERQLDISSVATRLRSSHVWFVRVRESRRLLVLHLVQSCIVAELCLHLQQCIIYFLYTSGLLVKMSMKLLLAQAFSSRSTATTASKHDLSNPRGRPMGDRGLI